MIKRIVQHIFLTMVVGLIVAPIQATFAQTSASGIVGLEVVARAKPDGYTLLTGNVGTQSINPTHYKKLNYNPDNSFVPVGQFAELPFVLAVTTSLPVKSVKDLVERISQSLQQALAMPEVQQQLFAQGALIKEGSAQEFGQLIVTDRERYADIIISNKIALD